ncbi:alpha/beta hydrolase [Bradyrhizobium sp. CER78]|uniref:alpha/beta fold hydrolase n=1 Tax=Bradyrhizobium sp. CER78 TaxID=3039162 RepID=UPI00244D423E|nr:alpha/beta hydrolase [Bradyrhizobium sp. CER78]MDH2386441.1 alpha/beta hydrolase [Bradyrhizobium sp. CER78]
MSDRAPAIILVHGLLDSGLIWRPVLDVLGAAVVSGWIATDLAGMGSKCAAEGPFTLHRYADDVCAMIDRMSAQVVLVGHSMGTQIVELAAARRPKNVAGLLLLSPVPLGGVRRPLGVMRALAATGGDVEAQRKARRQLMGQPPDPSTLEFLTGLGREVKREVTEVLVRVWNEGVAEGRKPSVFDGPVLVATGDKDPFVTAAMSMNVSMRFPNASRIPVAGAGHWPQAERPQSVAKIISDFITSVSEGVGHNLPTAGRSGATLAGLPASDPISPR